MMCVYVFTDCGQEQHAHLRCVWCDSALGRLFPLSLCYKGAGGLLALHSSAVTGDVRLLQLVMQSVGRCNACFFASGLAFNDGRLSSKVILTIRSYLSAFTNIVVVEEEEEVPAEQACTRGFGYIGSRFVLSRL